MKITYDEKGKVIGYQIFGGEPLQPYIEADLLGSEVFNYRVVDEKLIPKTQEELDVDVQEGLITIQSELRPEIVEHRNEIIAKGVPYKGYHFQADTLSRMNLRDMVENADVLQYPFRWISWENEPVSFESPAELLALSTAMKNFISVTFGECFQVQTTLANATTESNARQVVTDYKET